MAVVNAAVRDRLEEAGVDLRVVNLAVNRLSRSLFSRSTKVPKVLRGIAMVIGGLGVREASVYIGVSGGFGQIYEAVLLLIARLRGARTVLHHHSYAYLGKPHLVTRLLTLVGGADAIHVTLSSGMSERLRHHYGVGLTLSVSNSVFLPRSDLDRAERYRLRTLGFISNVSVEKGIFDFIELCEALSIERAEIRALIAGPFQSSKVERQVHSRLSRLPQVEYVGAKYGAEKEAFLAAIDVLIFPTRYSNEAEPVTVHEAMSQGIPVIAYGRGCIPEVIGPECGLVIGPELPFVPAALEQLERWWADHDAFRIASKAAAARFHSIRSRNQSQFEVLLAGLVGVGDALSRRRMAND